MRRILIPTFLLFSLPVFADVFELSKQLERKYDSSVDFHGGIYGGAMFISNGEKLYTVQRSFNDTMDIYVPPNTYAVWRTKGKWIDKPQVSEQDLKSKYPVYVDGVILN